MNRHIAGERVVGMSTGRIPVVIRGEFGKDDVTAMVPAWINADLNNYQQVQAEVGRVIEQLRTQETEFTVPGNRKMSARLVNLLGYTVGIPLDEMSPQRPMSLP
jgi:hypothetical protein